MAVPERLPRERFSPTLHSSMSNPTGGSRLIPLKKETQTSRQVAQYRH